MVAAVSHVLTCSCGHRRILAGEPEDICAYPLPGRLPQWQGDTRIYLGGRVLTEREHWELEHKECRR